MFKQLLFSILRDLFRGPCELVDITLAAGILGAGGVLGRLLKTGTHVKTRTCHQVVEVAVVGAVIKNSVPSLRRGVPL